MKKKKNIDESFKYGPVEVARSGKVISMKNIGSEEMNDEVIKNMAREFNDLSLQIDDLVEEIKSLIQTCNPLELLKYAYNNFIQSTGGVASEVQLSREDVYVARELEYIQSVLVSSENKYDASKEKEEFDAQEKFQLISRNINKLYILTQFYFMFRMADLKSRNDIEVDLEKEQFLMEAQLSMFVRGDRYQIYEITHLKELLEPHNDEFVKLYNITVDEFIDGISDIQKSLTSVENSFKNILDENGLYQIIKLYKEYEEFEKKEIEINKDQTIEDIMKKFQERIACNLDLDKSKDSYDTFDLEKITSWPKALLKDLSFKINENKYFYNNEYSGLPLIELPVFEKPFIEIENKFYCFDYYNLFDNIYRVLQKVIRKKDSSYRDMWGIRQMEATEKMVAELFKKILPDCIVYTSNYYPKNKSLKQCNENDVLVLYDDNLIIVEVKAGSYTYRAPILDIDSHVKSLQTLVEKADGQAERTLNYLKSNKTVKLYNKDKTEKCNITLGDFNDITLMCLTLDNFNEFSSKIEKLKFLNINKNSIALSIDDFRVYSDYFDSPLVFLHYLKQRKLATQNSALYLNDELDHLGMYIEHNMYSKIFEGDDNGQIIAYGYREKLDEYFSSLINKGFEVDKPKQKMPVEFREIIDYLNRSNLNERVKLATVLLDFSSEERENTINNIKKVLNRQREINRMLILNLFEEKPMCIYCHQEGIENITDECAKEYTLATMLEAGESSRTELHLYYNNINKLKYIKFHFYTLSDIPKEREKEFVELGHKYFNTKLITYKQQNNIKKIGRNDLCPCGSGKKYKKCHGK